MIIPRQLPNVAAAVDCLPTIVVCAILASLAWIAVLLRLWTKFRIVKTVGWDDWIMLVATAFFTVYCGAVIDISTRVTATHTIVSYNDLLISINLLNVSEIFYVLSVMALKISLSVFFLRLTTELWQRRVVLVALAVSSSYSVIMFFFVVFQCGVYPNITVFLLRRIGDKCASNSFTLGMTYTHAAITTLTDWTFLVLPIFILKNSLMKKNEKRTVVFVLMFASVGGIASIIRFKFILGLAVPKAEFFLNARDIAIWSCIEPGVGIVAGSVVTLRPLIRKLVVLFKSRGSYSGSKFPRRRSPPSLDRVPSSVHPQQPQRNHEFLQHQRSIQEMGIVEEKAVVETEAWVRPPIAKKRSSGLPLNLFGSIKSKSSSKRTKSTKSSTSRFSTFSIAPTIPDMPSFIWRETTDDTEDGSVKGSNYDEEKFSERGDPGMGPSPTWLERSEEDWLEEQLSLEQRSPTVDEHDRRFSQMSSIPSPRFPPSSAAAQSLRWHQRYESASSRGLPETPIAPLSPMFPRGHVWHQALDTDESRQSSRPATISPESIRIPIGLATEPVSQIHTPGHVWHQRQGSENSIMQARIESIPQNPASYYQGRTSEDSVRWPSTPASAQQEENLRVNQETFPPRISSRIFPPRRSSRMPLPQDNAVRFQPYRVVDEEPVAPPPITPRRFWQQKPLPRPPPVERKPVPKSILKKPVPPPQMPPMPPEPPTPKRKEKKSRSSGLPLDIFFQSSHASSSSRSSL